MVVSDTGTEVRTAPWHFRCFFFFFVSFFLPTLRWIPRNCQLYPGLALSYTRLFSVTLVTGSGFVRAERTMSINDDKPSRWHLQLSPRETKG